MNKSITFKKQDNNMNLSGYKRYFFMSMIIIALGVVLSTTLRETVGALGIVLIAIGGLFFIISMNMKKQEDKSSVD